MATVTAALAWSVPVPPDRLIAHLTAYNKLHSKSGTIHSLRLCHRFGTGEKVAITKLPAELLLEVEGYLMDEERTKERETSESQFKCWENRCTPIDHLSEEEQRKEYLMIFDEGITRNFNCDCYWPELGDEEGEYCDRCEEAIEFEAIRDGKGLTDWQKDILEDFMGDAFLSGGQEYWHYAHDSNAGLWEAHNKSCPKHNLSKESKTLLSDFGLGLFISHTQPKIGKLGQCKQRGVFRSTEAFLTVPSSAFKEEVRRPESNEFDWEDGRLFQPGEAGFSVGVAPPKKLSVKDIARFDRACSVLDLIPILPVALPSKVIGAGDQAKKTGSKETEWTSGEKKVTETKKTSSGRSGCVPTLRLLLNAAVAAEGDNPF